MVAFVTTLLYFCCMDIQWQASTFSELSKLELYEIIVLREAIFVVEQECIYQDADGKDLAAIHLVGREHGDLVAYCRIYPGDGGVHIGRVATAKAYRKKGLAYQLMEHAHKIAVKRFQGFSEIHISAQKYLQAFYEKIGYEVKGDDYLEDGIPHVAMTRSLVYP